MKYFEFGLKFHLIMFPMAWFNLNQHRSIYTGLVQNRLQTLLCELIML